MLYPAELRAQKPHKSRLSDDAGALKPLMFKKDALQKWLGKAVLSSGDLALLMNLCLCL